MAIDILTFTGVDARTDIDRVLEIQRRYPKVEFAVLIGSKTDEMEDDIGSNGIFPSKPVIRNFRNRCADAGTMAAIHLCGNWSRAVLNGESHFRGIPWGMVTGMCQGFHRVQLNSPVGIRTPEVIAANPQVILDFAEELMAEHPESEYPTKKVILQHHTTFESVPIFHDSIEYLYDKSGGRGKESFNTWPFPSALRRSGYSGGLGISNIDRVIEFANRHKDFPMWFDMESRIRTNGWLDLDRVEVVCEVVFPEGSS